MAVETANCRVCVVGGGPAGIMAGLLFARAGVDALVLEKHGDFNRDFRGDTIHPSTLDLMAELGFLDELLRRPHQKAPRLEIRFGDRVVPLDFSRVPARCRFVAFMPQWDFLDFLAGKAAAYPDFRLRMNAAATDLIERDGKVVGVLARTPAGELEVRGDLVIGADGRDSIVRSRAGLGVDDLGAPIDVLWFRVPRRSGDPELPVVRFQPGGAFIMLNQGPHWQCGYVIRKGAFDEIRSWGLEEFRLGVARLAPLVGDRLGDLDDWDKVKLLTVRVDRLRRWYREGLLCIGDAAHAMSPVGGVGINLAIQDAVAAANLLARPLRAGRPSLDDLRRVQRRRFWPARATQRLQTLLQDRVIARVVRGGARVAPPLFFRLMSRLPLLRRIPGRIVGVGFRPERLRERAYSGVGSERRR